MLNNINRLHHSSTINNIVTNKIKHFPQLFALGPQISLKLTWHHLLPQSAISTKLDIHVYKHKDANICKVLLQTICLVLIKYSIGFLDWILWPWPKSNCLFSIPAPISGNFPDTRFFYISKSIFYFSLGLLTVALIFRLKVT